MNTWQEETHQFRPELTVEEIKKIVTERKCYPAGTLLKYMGRAEDGWIVYQVIRP